MARLRLIGCGGLLVVVARWLLALELGAPASRELGWTSVSRWYEEAGPLPIAVFALRGAALVMVAWLALAVALQLVASVPGLGRLRVLADAVSPAAVRRIGGGVMSLSITAALGAPTDPAQVTTDPPREPVAVMVLVDSGTHAQPEVVAPPEPAAPARPVPIAPAPARDEGIVRAEAGDSLWTIAEAALEDATGRPATDGDVARYWGRLIAENRASLVDPDNPDLIYPGQEFRLPHP